jgi:hypothetical protein
MYAMYVMEKRDYIGACICRQLLKCIVQFLDTV